MTDGFQDAGAPDQANGRADDRATSGPDFIVPDARPRGDAGGDAGGDQTRALNREPCDGDVRQIFDAIYAEVRRLVANQLRHIGGPRRGNGIHLTLDSVVHEAFVKLLATKRWDSRAHFYGAASNATFQVIVNWIRKNRRHAKSIDDLKVDPAVLMPPSEIERVERSDALIERFRDSNERWARVAQMRLFGHMSFQAIAEMLGVSERTVERDWQLFRGLMDEELRDGS